MKFAFVLLSVLVLQLSAISARAGDQACAGTATNRVRDCAEGNKACESAEAKSAEGSTAGTAKQ